MSLRKKNFVVLSASSLLLSSVSVADENPTVSITKTPWCGCCQVWTDALENAGYHIVVSEVSNMTPVRMANGVTKQEYAGCHTATVEGYTLEGHVPLEAIDKLLAEKPKVKGLTVPGMPMGSLGMGTDPNAKYSVLAFTNMTSKTPEVYMEMGK